MPAIGSTFKTDQPLLDEILDDIRTGATQLPDFQRGWVWDDHHIRSLIASISLSYPIGAVMLLETGGNGVRFKPRLVEGVKLQPAPKPDRLILDGQQRLTSLYLALRSGKPVPTRTEKGFDINRIYFLNMAGCLDPDGDRFDAVLSLPPSKTLTSDFGREVELDVSTREKEYAQCLFPLDLVFDPGAFTEWKLGFQEHYGYSPEKTRFLSRFEQEIWLRFQQYKVPVIELLKETPKEAVCQVFEKVNTGGVTLSVFELVTATFAADDFELRPDWERREHALREFPVLRGVDATSFLTAVTLLSTYERSRSADNPVSCKRRDVLKLKLEEYRCRADRIQSGLVRAAKLLAREKVFDGKSLPYTTQLIPLSAICAVLGDRFEEEPIKQKLARWFWSGVFGELYGGANESRFAFDVPEVMAWIDGGDDPRTLKDSSFSPTRLISLQTRNSAAYKGLMVLLTKGEGSRDFLNGDTIELNSYFDLAIDIHHIFPRSFCEKRGINDYLANCSVNKAPLSARTNRIIGGNAPSSYLASLEKNHGVGPDKLDEILATHQMNPSLLRGDDFLGFIRDRAARLLDLIEKATGKTVSGRDSEEVLTAFGGPLVVAD